VIAVPNTAAGATLIESRIAHAPSIAVLHRQCFEEAWTAFTIRKVMAMPGAFGILAVTGTTSECVVADSRGEIELLGFALARVAADECELLSLAVAESARGQGLGTLLLGATKARVETAGLKRLFLEVAEDNTVARHLYAAHGFVSVGIRPGYYRRRAGPAVAALTLALQTGPGSS
jgi:ribosomal-protein-alanine N-acetyltransferase